VKSANYKNVVENGKGVNTLDIDIFPYANFHHLEKFPCITIAFLDDSKPCPKFFLLFCPLCRKEHKTGCMGILPPRTLF